MGSKELDLIFTDFIREYETTFNIELLLHFEELLNYPDDLILFWLLGTIEPPFEVKANKLWELLNNYVRTKFK